jgi:hypothetical protein
VRKIRLVTAVMVEMKLERGRMITWRGMRMVTIGEG